jgi:lipocalin-like protein
MVRQNTVSSLPLIGTTESPILASSATGSREEIVGAWLIVSTDTVRSDGSRVPTFGPNPKGLVVFDGSGHYALQLMSATLIPVAANNRLEGTPDENRAIVQGSVAHFGRYSVDEVTSTLTLHIDGSTFPNWIDRKQDRHFTVSNSELRWKTPAASGGGSAELVWKRVR